MLTPSPKQIFRMRPDWCELEKLDQPYEMLLHRAGVNAKFIPFNITYTNINISLIKIGKDLQKVGRKVYSSYYQVGIGHQVPIIA